MSLDELIEKAQNSIDDLINLKIQKLMVSDLKTTNVDGKEELTLDTANTVTGITSRINLIDGDITTEIAETFYKNYPELVQFHQSRETQGHQIIENNIKVIGEIISTVKLWKPS
jgi:hypothetical protein